MREFLYRQAARDIQFMVARTNWNIFIIAETDSLVKARGNFLVSPHCTIESHPDIDVLVVAGGIHTEEIMKSNVIQWISKVATSAQKAVSVCTGAFLLAETGLLNGLSATTHWEDIPALKSGYPKICTLENQRWVSQGKFVTSGGISAGIDMSLHLVAELSSIELAEKTARQMEYHWRK